MVAQVFVCSRRVLRKVRSPVSLAAIPSLMEMLLRRRLFRLAAAAGCGKLNSVVQTERPGRADVVSFQLLSRSPARCMGEPRKLEEPRGGKRAMSAPPFPSDEALSYDVFCEKLEELREAVEKRDREEESGAGNEWYDGRDFHRVFEDEECVVFISDMYAALNPSFLRDHHVDIVVNMMGPPNVEDAEKSHWGAQSHYEEDKAKYAEEWNRDESVKKAREASAKDYFEAGPAAFYETHGVTGYVEEASADSQRNVISEHFHVVNEQVWRHIRNVQKRGVPPAGEQKNAVGTSEQDSRTSRGAREKCTVLFHCYGGRNRSAAAMCAFWYLWNLYNGRGLSMYEVIWQAVSTRPKILSRKKWDKRHWAWRRSNHDNFLKTLVIWGHGISGCIAVKRFHISQ